VWIQLLDFRALYVPNAHVYKSQITIARKWAPPGQLQQAETQYFVPIGHAMAINPAWDAWRAEISKREGEKAMAAMRAKMQQVQTLYHSSIQGAGRAAGNTASATKSSMKATDAAALARRSHACDVADYALGYSRGVCPGTHIDKNGNRVWDK
jgi:hypothetical protein